MGRFVDLGKIKEQAELIETLADRGNGDIGRHAEKDADTSGHSGC